MRIKLSLIIFTAVILSGCNKTESKKTYVCKCSGTTIFTQTGTESNVASRCAVEADNYIDNLIDTKVAEDWVSKQEEIDAFEGTEDQFVFFFRQKELESNEYRRNLESSYSTRDCGISDH